MTITGLFADKLTGFHLILEHDHDRSATRCEVYTPFRVSGAYAFKHPTDANSDIIAEKLALRRALEPFRREDRAAIWQAFWSRNDASAETVKRSAWQEVKELLKKAWG